MEFNLIEYYGFLTREEYEEYYFKVLPDKMKKERTEDGIVSRGLTWSVFNGADMNYPKTLVKAKVELRVRGLDPGDAEYGLVRVIESGEVAPAGGMWKKSDIDLAMISLAELGCIEPWVYACKCFNVKPVDYVKVHRAFAEKHVALLGQLAEEPLLCRYEFLYGKRMIDPGTLTLSLREDWEEIAQRISNGT